MKKLIFSIVVMMVSFATFAQVQLDKPLQLTGTGADAKIEGLKSVTQSQDAVSAEVVQKNSLIYSTSTNIGNVFAVTLTPSFSALTPGQIVHFNSSAANTGGVTLNVNSIGAKEIRKNFDVALVSNDIKAGQLVSVMYDSTNDRFQMLSQTGNSTSGGGSIPSGMIAIFSNTCPTGWTLFSDLTGKFPRGSTTFGATGGSNTHTHTVSLGSTTKCGFCDNAAGAAGTYTTSSASNLPPYLEVIYCQKD